MKCIAELILLNIFGGSILGAIIAVFWSFKMMISDPWEEYEP